jgi:hypothetical protein
MHRPSLTGAALVALFGCGEPASEPTGEGGVAVQIIAASSGSVALDGGKVYVRGPTNKTVNATPGQQVTVTGLSPGTYTVSLEGLVGTEVDQFGQTSGIEVVKDKNTAAVVTVQSFVPAANPLPALKAGKTFTIDFTPVVGAASYEVEVATDQNFTTNRAAFGAAATPADITVTNFGSYFVRVRAIDAFQGRSRPSGTQPIELAPRGLLYLIRDSDDMFQRLDPETLQLTDVGLLGVPYSFGDCAWDPANSTFYVVDGSFNGAQNALYRVDLTTGAATLVGFHGINNMFALGYHPGTNTLFGISGFHDDTLFTIDATNGSASQVGLTSANTQIEGLVWDPVRNRFVAHTAGLEQFFSIDVTTGASTPITSPGPSINDNGMAYDRIIDRFWVADFNGNIIQYADPGYARDTVATAQGQHTCIAYVPQ